MPSESIETLSHHKLCKFQKRFEEKFSKVILLLLCQINPNKLISSNTLKSHNYFYLRIELSLYIFSSREHWKPQMDLFSPGVHIVRSTPDVVNR